MIRNRNHLVLFTNGQKLRAAGSRRMIEVLVKDEQDNILSTIRENATLANKDIQDYSAVLLALRKARELGADNITLFLDNRKVCGQLNSIGSCSDSMLQAFHEEAQQLIALFDSVIVKRPSEEKKYYREFNA